MSGRREVVAGAYVRIRRPALRFGVVSSVHPDLGLAIVAADGVGYVEVALEALDVLDD
jgi:hypothetical protein